MTTDQIKQYLNLNAQCLNIRGIERAAGVPDKTLDHFLKGRRGLTKKNIRRVADVLSGLNTYQLDIRF